MKPRTSKDIDDDLSKTLYIRLPRTIKSSDEIKDLFLGDAKVRMPRQSSRYCHVVFENVEEKMKNLKNIKKLVIEGKHIVAFPPKINPKVEKKKKEKKVRVPEPRPEPKVTKTLHISNIKPGTKLQEIKDAFPGCTSVVMLPSKSGKNRKAILKLGSVQLAGEYLRKEREWPVVRDNCLAINADTRKRSKTGKTSSASLKIYDGDGEETGHEKSKGSTKRKPKERSRVSQDPEEAGDDDDDDDAEDVDDSESDKDSSAVEEE